MNINGMCMSHPFRSHFSLDSANLKLLQQLKINIPFTVKGHNTPEYY